MSDPRKTQRKVTELLVEIANQFTPDAKVILLVQHPDNPDATMILSNADLDAAAEIIYRQKQKGGH